MLFWLKVQRKLKKSTLFSSKYKNSSEWLWNSNKSIENSILSDGKKNLWFALLRFSIPDNGIECKIGSHSASME